MKNKYLIVFDTLCTGHQTGGDPELFDSEADAMFEMFGDAIAGLEGTDDEYFEENEIDKSKTITEMSDLLQEGNSEKMRNYFNQNPECNYYDEFIMEEEDYVKGYKTIYK